MLPILFRFWTETWRTPARARLFYLVLAGSFATLAGLAIALGDASVAVLAAVAAAVTVALAFLAPKLARWTGSGG